MTSVRVERCTVTAAAWDDFAHAASASFRCGYHASRAWQYEHHLWFRMRRLDVLLRDAGGRETKIGQVGVGVGRSISAFGDALQLLPEHADRWEAAMSAVLRHLGDGAYVYGSDWCLAPPREQQLARVPGVTIDAIAPTAVQVIDFARWPTFDAYRMAVSSNVRRNVKKAQRSYPSLTLNVRPGWQGVAHFFRGLSLRRDLFRRKGVRRSTLGMAARSAARMASLSRYTETAQLDAGDATIASYVGVNFGDVHNYLEGAGDDAGRGGSWFLLMAMIERAYVATGGRGRFVMGSDDGAQDGVAAWEGLKRSRRQCCAEPVPTSVVRLTYRAPRRAGRGRVPGVALPRPARTSAAGGNRPIDVHADEAERVSIERFGGRRRRLTSAIGGSR